MYGNTALLVFEADEFKRQFQKTHVVAQDTFPNSINVSPVTLTSGVSSLPRSSLAKAMEDDSAGNTDSMEKSAHFSISAALSQWLDVCGLPEIVSKMQRFASITKWSEDIVGECLNEVSEVMMCCEDAVSVEFIHFFGPIMLELLQRASRVQLDSQLNHQQMCVLLGRLIMDNKSTSK